MAGGTQQFMFFLLVATAFALGMWRSFSDPQLAQPQDHTGETILRGSQSISTLESTLARQQEMIDALLKSQANQQQILQQQQQQAQTTVVESMKQNQDKVSSPPLPQQQQPQEIIKEKQELQVSPPPPPPPPPMVVKKASNTVVGHSHNSKGWEPAVVAHTLENAIKAVTNAKGQLKNKYGEDLANELFKLDNQIAYNGRLRDKKLPSATPVFLDNNSRQLLIKRLLSKLAAPKDDNEMKTFTIAFGGHSSAAAHGNYYNQSYAHAFERMLGPAMKAAGIKLVIRNHAMGGTGCIPSAYCSGNVYGEDLDAISWDFGMTDGRNIDHAELYFRQAILQHHQTKIKNNNGNDNIDDVYGLPPLLLLAHNTDNAREELLHHYSTNGFEVAGIRMNQAINIVPKTTSIEHANHLPDALKYLECADTISWDDCKAQRYDCIQQCGEEKGAICHGQVSWHPGWRYHQLKGDLLSVIFLEALSDAARKYQTFTMEMGPNLDADMYQVPKYPSERPLPKPLLCGKASSSVDAILCNIALNCATSFEPRMGQGTLDLSPRYDVKQHPKQYKGWEVSLSPGEGDNTAACTGHLDQKFNTLSKNNNQWLDMKIDNVKHGTAIICEGPFSQRYAKLVGYINTTEGGNAKIKLDSHNWHYERKLSKSLCSVISDKLSPGTHMISIQTSSTKSFTGFSHLIWA